MEEKQYLSSLYETLKFMPYDESFCEDSPVVITDITRYVYGDTFIIPDCIGIDEMWCDFLTGSLSIKEEALLKFKERIKRIYIGNDNTVLMSEELNLYNRIFDLENAIIEENNEEYYEKGGIVFEKITGRAVFVPNNNKNKNLIDSEFNDRISSVFLFLSSDAIILGYPIAHLYIEDYVANEVLQISKDKTKLDSRIKKVEIYSDGIEEDVYGHSFVNGICIDPRYENMIKSY